MPQETDLAVEYVTYSISISIAGETLQAEVPVPAGVTRPVEMLPIYQSVSDAILNHTVQAAGEAGHPVSCRPGCAACCRKLVPVSQWEARRIREIMDSLPADCLSEVLARFGEARHILRQTGLLDRLGEPAGLGSEEISSLGPSYFERYISCPFLDQERCIIYEERPIACRECLVTSPPEDCFPESKTRAVRQLVLPCSVSAALARSGVQSEPGPARWVPLIVVPEWVDANPETPPVSTGPELMREILIRL